MSDPRTADDGAVTDGGSSTDQYVTGTGEEGSFLTDEAPTPTTPAHGSSNAGVNATKANRPETTEGDAGS